MRGHTVCILCIGSFILGCTITLNLVILEDQSRSSANQPATKYLSQRQFHPLLIILILSNPSNALQRAAMRETWLSVLDKKHLYYFVVGMQGVSLETAAQIKQENFKHNDFLLLPDLEDNYAALTQKVLSAFKYIHPLDFQYVLKCDDDTFVETIGLVKELEIHENSGESLYWGFFRGDAKVKIRGQWKETEWNICDMYLPYALGGGYVLSKDLVTFIVNNSFQLRQFRNEDVSVGAWLATIKTNRKHDVRFNTEYRSRGCSNTYLVMHKQSPKNMRELHNNLQTIGKLCTVEKRNALSFYYNWNALPSECCLRNNKNVP